MNLSELDPTGLARAAEELELPHLAAFVASIARAQASRPGGTVRSYLRDLVQRGWFEIVSPVTGATVRSGSSLLLSDSVVYSFPAEPALLLAAGDLSLGFPLGALRIAPRDRFLYVAKSPWGIAERHLAEIECVAAAAKWAPGPATQPVQLIVGHPNFAHHAWNQLSAIDELLDEPLPNDVRLLVSTEPLGPIREIFPEIKRRRVSRLRTQPSGAIHEASLLRFNATGAVFAPAGGRAIRKRLIDRVLRFAAKRMSRRGRALATHIAAAGGPVLWMSVRTRNRTATNQHELLTELGRRFLAVYPGASIVIDGFSLPADDHRRSRPERREMLAVVRADMRAADAVRTALRAERRGARVHVAVGLSIPDALSLSRYATVYFCHHGTVQHKIGWFNATRGMVHSNRTILQAQPKIAAFSEVALEPLYLDHQLVSDSELPAGHDPGPNHELLSHENYTIADIPAAVDAFFSHLFPPRDAG